VSEIPTTAGTEDERDKPARVASGRLGLETLVVKVAIYAYGLPGSIVLARTLGPGGRGAYQVAVTTSLIVLTLVLFGMPQSQFRSWGGRRREEMLSVARLAAILFGVLGFGVCVWVRRLGGRTFAGESGNALVLIGASMPLQVHAACLMVLLQSAGRTRLTNAALAVSGFAQTTGILVLGLAGGLTVWTTSVTYTGGLALQWLVLQRSSRVIGRPAPRAPIRTAATLARAGLVFQTFIVAQLLLLRVDVLFVARIADLSEVGIYAVAVTLAELVWLVTDSLAQVMVERATAGGESESIVVFLRAARMALVLGCAGAAAAAALAPFAVRHLFGGDFASAAPVVGLLMPGIVAMGLWRTISPAVVRYGSIWTQPAYSAAALVVNVGLNLYLIAPLGARGAALASSAAYVLAGGLAARWLLRRAGFAFRTLRPGLEELRAIARLIPGLR